MRGRVYITVLCLMVSFTAWAQSSGIQLTKHQNQRIKFIKEGTKTLVRHGALISKGPFTILSDSTILVNTDTILISNVQEIRVRNIGNQITGGAMALIGSYLFVVGIVGIAAIAADMGQVALLYGIIFLPVGVGCVWAAATGIGYLTKGKKYSGNKWDYRILSGG